MKSVLVGKSNNTKIYYVLDANSNNNDGVLVDDVGNIKVINFWEFVSKKSNINKMQHSKFHKFLWNKPTNIEKRKWQSIFITKSLAPDDDLIDSIVVNNDVLNRTQIINQIANRALDFKIALSSQTLEKKILGQMGRRIGRAIGPNRKIGKRVFREVEGVLDPQKRRDGNNDGMIFDGTIREMPAPPRGLRSSTSGEQVAVDGLPESQIATVDDQPRKLPPGESLPQWTDMQGNRKKRLLQLLKLTNPGAGKQEILNWFRDHLKGVSINDILKRLRKKEDDILKVFGVDEIKNAKQAREILASIYPNAVTERNAYLPRDAGKKRKHTFFEFLWYNPDGSRRDENDQLSDSEKTLFLSHLRLIQQNQTITQRVVHYISGTTSYRAPKSFVDKYIKQLSSGGISSLEELIDLMPDFLRDQILDDKTPIIPYINVDPNGDISWKLISIEKAGSVNWTNYQTYMQMFVPLIRMDQKEHVKELTQVMTLELFQVAGQGEVLGYVGVDPNMPNMFFGLDFLPSIFHMDDLEKNRQQNLPVNKTRPEIVRMMYRDSQTDGKVSSSISGIRNSGTLTDQYFSMSSISNRILVARELIELSDVKDKKNIQKQIDRIIKKQTKLKESTVELSLSEEFSILQKDLQDLEIKLRDVSVLTDEITQDFLKQLNNISTTATTYHENGHFLHGIAKSNDVYKKLSEERQKRILELRSKSATLTPDEQKEYDYLNNPDLSDKMLLPWLFKHLHLNAEDEEIVPRLIDTETELAILGLIQIFGNISTPLDINTGSPTELNVLRKNSILGLLVEALQKNRTNSNPGIASAANEQLKEVVELHKHKLKESIIDPVTSLPVQVSESTIKKIVERNRSAIKFLQDNPSIGDYSNIQERLKLLTPTSGDLTLENLLKIIATEQIIGQFGLDKPTRMSGSPHNLDTYYPQGLILGTDASIEIRGSNNSAIAVMSPGENKSNLIYGANVTDILPTVAKYGLPKFFNEEDNKAFIRSINSYALSHLGHYANAVQGQTKPLVKPSNDARKDIELISARGAFKILKNAYGRLRTNTVGENTDTKNHTVSSYLSAMPNLGMYNLAKLIESNAVLKDKSKKGNLSEFYKLLDANEKKLVRKAIFDDTLQMQLKRVLEPLSHDDKFAEGIVDSLEKTLKQGNISLSDTTKRNLIQSLTELIPQFMSTDGATEEMFRNDFMYRIAQVVGPEFQNRNMDNNYVIDFVTKFVAAQESTSFGPKTVGPLIKEMLNYFSWDDLSENEIETILNLVQRWGGHLGEPSYAMHDYRTAQGGHLIGALRLMTLGKRLEWAEIHAELNLLLETGIPFLTDGRNLTEEELNSLTKLIQWMRPDEKKLPEIKSLQTESLKQREDRWLI